MESSWRLISDGGVAVGSGDRDPGYFGPFDAAAEAYRLLEDHRVVGAMIADHSADLSIDFDAGVRLDVFNDSPLYEAWNLHGPGRRLIVATPGGDIAEWEE